MALPEARPEDVGMDPERIANLRRLMATWVARGDMPALVGLVARHGKVVLHEAFGVRVPEDTAPTLRRDAVFPVASVSKPITAACIMCLVDDGLIGLNRPFLEYVPELDVPGAEALREASVADLLRHTGGMDEVAWNDFIRRSGRWDGPEPPPVPGRHPILNRLIHAFAGAPLANPPGTVMSYNNHGYILLGDIVRRASGLPLRQFAEHRLFAPLGMDDTHYGMPEAQQHRRIRRAPDAPGTRAVAPWAPGVDAPERGNWGFGAGGVTSTTADLALFLQMLLQGGMLGGRRVLSSASVAAMTRDQLGEAGRNGTITRIDPATGTRHDIPLGRFRYGYGMVVFGDSDRFVVNGALMTPGAFGHAGSGGSVIWADPATGLVGVYLSISPRQRHNGAFELNADLFQNAAHAAVLE